MTSALGALKPRKTPVQARSAATIEALHEAAIQVLTKEGLSRCTTTRIAKRAGISVGSLYQYYPNRDVLLTTVLKEHLALVSGSVSQACRSHHGKPAREMARALITAFLNAKLRDPAKSRSLFAFAQERGQFRLASRHRAEMAAAIAEMLESAPDASFPDASTTAVMVLSVLSGPVQAVLEGRASSDFVSHLERELVLLISAYLEAHS